jgi:protein-tyrosine phosphatase
MSKSERNLLKGSGNKMKNLTVERTENYLKFSLDQRDSGRFKVNVSKNPLTLALDHTLTLDFSEGSAFLPVSEVEGREFYSLIAPDHQAVGAERRVALPSLYNCRDLGGYVTTDGRLTKWGYIYRSDAPDHLTKDDVAFLSEMALAAVIDFRSPKEIAHNPDNYFAEKRHYQFDPHAEVAKEASLMPTKGADKDQQKVAKLLELAKTKAGQQRLVEMQQQMVYQMEELVLSAAAQQAYTDFMKVLVRQEVPCLFHCQGGKDRTGWAAAIILGLLGVPEETIYQDYFLTEINNEPRNQARMAIYQQYTDNAFVLDYLASLQKTKRAYLDSAFNAMKTHYGTMEAYAKQALGMNQETIEQFKEMYLY